MNILIAAKDQRKTQSILERSRAYFGPKHLYTLSSELQDAKLKLKRTNTNVLISELQGSLSSTTTVSADISYLTAISIEQMQEECIEPAQTTGQRIIYVKKPFTKAEVVQALANLFEQLEPAPLLELPPRFMVPVSDGYRFLKAADIVRVQASGSYSIFHLTDNTKLTLSNRIGHYQRELMKAGFARIHSSHMINVNYVKKYVRHGGLHVILENGDSIPISRGQRDEFECGLKHMIRL